MQLERRYVHKQQIILSSVYLLSSMDVTKQEKAKDYVIATGKTHSVGEFIAKACEYAGLPSIWHSYVKINDSFRRPSDVHCLVGDASLARLELGWKPRVTFEQLVQMMVEADMQLVVSKTSKEFYYEYAS